MPLGADLKERVVQRRQIGGRKVSALGLGAMPMSLEDRPPREQAIRTIHAALDAGISLIDTADAYCVDANDTGHNERLVGEALASWGGSRDAVLVATKGGHYRQGDGSWQLDGRPEYLRAACEASLRALGTDVIDLYQFHRPDPKVPVAESVGALAELQRDGKVTLIGVSNFSVAMLEEVAPIATIASVQNEFSPAFRSSRPELRYCQERDIAFLAWSPLGGMGAAADLAASHPTFSEIAAELDVSAQQVALAWELARSEGVVPIPGASRPQSVADSTAAVHLELSDEDLAALSA